MRLTKKDKIRFWGKVNKTDACWLWTASLSGNGYGQMSVRQAVGPRRPILAHRLSYLIHVGPIEPGLFVCHHCDVRPCVRPDHLFLGTCKQNLEDASNKGRMKNIYQASKTVCKNGHEFSKENTRIVKTRSKTGTARQCKACALDKYRDYYSKNKKALYLKHRARLLKTDYKAKAKAYHAKNRDILNAKKRAKYLELKQKESPCAPQKK